MMPSLEPGDIDLLLLGKTHPCPTCPALCFKNYCRECDEFFWQCPAGCLHDHPGHRTYEKEVTPCPS